MTVRFTKAKNANRTNMTTCIRKDGSTTIMPSTDFFVRHELTHFASEGVLGYEDAFYRLIAKGWDVDSFSEREPGSRKAHKRPEVALQAEILVGALDLDWTMELRSPAEVIKQLVESLPETLSLPSEDQIREIRLRRDELWKSWNTLPIGDTLELCF